jgi:hypothetical protein
VARRMRARIGDSSSPIALLIMPVCASFTGVVLDSLSTARGVSTTNSRASNMQLPAFRAR